MLTGLFWLTLGIYAAASPKISHKILTFNYGYIAAWMIMFGLPSTFFVWLALRKPKSIHREGKPKIEKEVVISELEKTLYEESYPELNREETQLQEIQEIEEDMYIEDEENESQISQGQIQPHKKINRIPTENIYTTHIEQPESPLDYNELSYEPSEDVTSTFTCRICDKEISEGAYLSYDGMCYLCWLKEIRRSGLLGADRASTW